MNPDATLAKLMEAWLDGGLPDDEQAGLLRKLDEDPDLRRRFAAQVAILGATRASADPDPRWLALFDALEIGNESGTEHGSFEAATMNRIEATHRRPVPWANRIVWGLAAAAVVMLAGLVFLKTRPSGSESPPPVAGGTPPPVSGSVVAVAVAGSPEASVRPGTYLMPEVISQRDGWLTIQTIKGVSVTLLAPFEAILNSDDRIHLKSGVARVFVPDGAEGFRLECAAFDIVDLGTEFAAKVNSDGTGTCRVFQGKADVSLLDSVGESKETRRLVANESVRIDRSRRTLETIEERDVDYPDLKQGPRPKLRLAPDYPGRVQGLNPAGYWRFEQIADGLVPDEVPNSARMRAAGGAAIAVEEDGNHSGELTRLGQPEFFKVQGGTKAMMERDFTISFFAQFSWLQNFALISAMRYDNQVQGHSLILQCYASLWKIGIKGSALQSILRDPPAWDGGDEILGQARLQPLRWHHLALTRQNGSVTIFLDGQVVARGAGGSAPLDCPEIFVGRLNGNAAQSRAEARGLVGHIDELAIFSRALTEESIRLLAAHGDGAQ